MLQPLEVVAQVAAANPTGDVCLPWAVVASVGAGFAAMGGFVLKQWMADQERSKRLDQWLEELVRKEAS